MHLPESLRESLKRPLGLLLKDRDATKDNILKNIPAGAFLITVGDATTEKMVGFGLEPSLQIVDSLERRHKRELPGGNVATVLECVNPAAEITNESIRVIKKGLESTPPVRIVVSGEEDLLVIPVALNAPSNSVIMYGQPNEGLVIVVVNQEVRQKAKEILDSMS